MHALDEVNIYLDAHNQSWRLLQHASHNGRKLRFRIRKGAYEATSSATVEIQDVNTKGWLPLAFIPASQMKSDMHYVCEKLDHPANRVSTMMADLKELENKASLLLCD